MIDDAPYSFLETMRLSTFLWLQRIDVPIIFAGLVSVLSTLPITGEPLWQRWLQVLLFGLAGWFAVCVAMVAQRGRYTGPVWYQGDEHSHELTREKTLVGSLFRVVRATFRSARWWEPRRADADPGGIALRYDIPAIAAVLVALVLLLVGPQERSDRWIGVSHLLLMAVSISAASLSITPKIRELEAGPAQRFLVPGHRARGLANGRIPAGVAQPLQGRARRL